MTKVYTYGHIEGGTLKISQRERFIKELSILNDCDVEVIVKKRGKRSTQANRYYWGCIVETIRIELLRRGNRFDAEDVHEWLKQKFNPMKVEIPETGELIELGGSTTEMNAGEFSDYIERIKEWASMTLELNIPDAGEQAVIF